MLENQSFFFQAEDGIRDTSVTGVQTCALPILLKNVAPRTIEAETNDDGHAHDDQRVERLRRSTVNALREVEDLLLSARSEERRVGKEDRAQWWRCAR